MITTKETSLKDLTDLFAIASIAREEERSEAGPDNSKVRGYVEFFDNNPGTGVIILAYEGDEVVGVLGLMGGEVFMGGTRAVKDLFFFVKESHRGSGAANELLDAAEEWSKGYLFDIMSIGLPCDCPGNFLERRGHVPTHVTFDKEL